MGYQLVALINLTIEEGVHNKRGIKFVMLILTLSMAVNIRISSRFL